jgi:hypothetical protein
MHDDGDAAVGRIKRIINFQETLISKAADLRPLVGPDSIGLHEAAGGMGAVGGKLQKTILFCRSSTLIPISRPSRMSLQVSGSFKGGMTFAKQYCYLSIGRTAANFRWGGQRSQDSGLTTGEKLGCDVLGGMAL